jgi:hypothetical protein
MINMVKFINFDIGLLHMKHAYIANITTLGGGRFQA